MASISYESQWKTEVDKEWKEYKIKWESEHPGEDPPKGRFAIMNKFMREKYKNESDNMKECCKQYHRALKDGIPAKLEADLLHTRNLQFEG